MNFIIGYWTWKCQNLTEAIWLWKSRGERNETVKQPYLQLFAIFLVYLSKRIPRRFWNWNFAWVPPVFACTFPYYVHNIGNNLFSKVTLERRKIYSMNHLYRAIIATLLKIEAILHKGSFFDGQQLLTTCIFLHHVHALWSKKVTNKTSRR